MLEIQVLACDKHKNAAGLNRLIGPQASLFWYLDLPTAINTINLQNTPNATMEYPNTNEIPLMLQWNTPTL
jgi:hypothetical protein